jgi:hypothetical protein
MPVFIDLAKGEKRPLKKRDGTIPAPAPVPTPTPAPVVEKMRVRILQRIASTKHGTFAVGQEAYLPVAQAKEWVQLGLAEFDKMLDSAPETK